MAHNLSSDGLQCDAIHLLIYYLITLLLDDSSWIRHRDFCFPDVTDSFFCFITADSMSHKVFSKSTQHLMQMSASPTRLFILKAKSISVSFKCTRV